jgi:iron uptake system component EfeO
MPRQPVPAVRAGVVAAALVAALAGCSSSSKADQAVAVTGTDTACTPATSTVGAGTVELRFDNKGSKVSELYVLRPDGSIVTEKEDVAPGVTARVTVELPAGSYTLQCKPGMTGDGIKAPLTVTGASGAGALPAASTDPRLATAVTGYRAYVAGEAASSLALAKQLAAAVQSGDVARAKALYAPSRVGWERVEPVAESFGDLDPRIDARQADLAEGETWSGWHVLEKGLWTSGSTKGLAPVAATLVKDLEELTARVPKATITPTSMANGANELLDEVAKGKVTGEEEAFSHTDLVDMQANVEGARKVVDLLGPVLSEKDAALKTSLDQRFAQLQTLLATHRGKDGFVSYETVTQDQRRALSAAVDALSEPLSKVAAAVVGR